MYQAKKKKSHSSIKFRSLLGSERKNQDFSTKMQSPSYETVFRKDLSQLTKKVDYLTEQTHFILKRPKEKPAFSRLIFLWMTLIAFFSSAITFFCLQNRQILLQKNFNSKIKKQKKELSDSIYSTSDDLRGEFSRLESQFLKQKNFTIDKVHHIEKQIDRHTDRFDQFSTRLSQCEINLSHLSQVFASHQLKSESLWKEEDEHRSRLKAKNFNSKMSYWEKKSKDLEERKAKNVLDRYQKNFYEKKEIKTITAGSSEKNRVYANAYAKIAWKESQVGNIQHAIAAYRKAITYHPTFSVAYYNLACLFAKIGKEDQSIFWLKQGRPYFSKKLLKMAMIDKDLEALRNNPYFVFLMKI